MTKTNSPNTMQGQNTLSRSVELVGASKDLFWDVHESNLVNLASAGRGSAWIQQTEQPHQTVLGCSECCCHNRDVRWFLVSTEDFSSGSICLYMYRSEDKRQVYLHPPPKQHETSWTIHGVVHLLDFQSSIFSSLTC